MRCFYHFKDHIGAFNCVLCTFSWASRSKSQSCWEIFPNTPTLQIPTATIIQNLQKVRKGEESASTPEPEAKCFKPKVVSSKQDEGKESSVEAGIEAQSPAKPPVSKFQGSVRLPSLTGILPFAPRPPQQVGVTSESHFNYGTVYDVQDESSAVNLTMWRAFRPVYSRDFIGFYIQCLSVIVFGNASCLTVSQVLQMQPRAGLGLPNRTWYSDWKLGLTVSFPSLLAMRTLSQTPNLIYLNCLAGHATAFFRLPASYGDPWSTTPGSKYIYRPSNKTDDWSFHFYLCQWKAQGPHGSCHIQPSQVQSLHLCTVPLLKDTFPAKTTPTQCILHADSPRRLEKWFFFGQKSWF